MRIRDYPVVWTSPVPDDLRAFEEHGYDSKPGFYSLERIQDFRNAAYALRDTYRGEAVSYERDGTTVRLIAGAQYVQPSLVDLLVTPKLVSLAESILGTGVYIHQFRLHFKPAFTGGEFFWHSDYSVWRWGRRDDDGYLCALCISSGRDAAGKRTADGVARHSQVS